MVGYISDIGRTRENNQDVFYVSEDTRIPLYMVADGMGGHKSGEVASAMAISIVQNNFLKKNDVLDDENEVLSLIKSSIEEANIKIYLKSLEDECFKGMGTTMTLAYVLDNRICIGHVGDSRAYLIKNDELYQLTEDHSYVNELIKMGTITKEEAINHPKKNMITRAVGTSSIINMDLFIETWDKSDILFICSDGLSNMLKEKEIKDVFMSTENIQDACNILASMANNKGGLDNITIVAVKFN